MPGNCENRYSDSSQSSPYQGRGRGAQLLGEIKGDAARQVRVRYTGEEYRILQTISTSISFIFAIPDTHFLFDLQEKIQVVDNRYVKDREYDRVVPDISDETIQSQTFESRVSDGLRAVKSTLIILYFQIEMIKERAENIAKCLQMANENND